MAYFASQEKRKAEESALVHVKKPRNELLGYSDAGKRLQLAEVGRTSSLEAPIMLLTGHLGELYCGKFHPDGTYLATSGFDRQIFFWNTLGECENFAVLSGHTGAVLDMHFSTDGGNVYKTGEMGRLTQQSKTVRDTMAPVGRSFASFAVWAENEERLLFTASTDKTLGVWDTRVGVRIKRLRGHSLYVNCCHPARRGPQLLCSGGDDSTLKLWDTRKRTPAHSFQESYQITAVSFNDTAEQVLSGGIDNLIKVWDLRKNAVLYRMAGHLDTVTGMSLSPDGSYLLSNSMDNTLRIWDVRPFAPQERCVKILQGHQHNFEKNLLRCGWSPDGAQVVAGSADRCVHVWDTTSRRLLYKLPGHKGSVNEVSFHPKEPIVLSVSSDKQVFLGEIDK